MPLFNRISVMVLPWENIKSFVVCSTIKICFNSQFFFSCSCEILTSLGVRHHLHLLTFPISNFFSQTIGPIGTKPVRKVIWEVVNIYMICISFENSTWLPGNTGICFLIGWYFKNIRNHMCDSIVTW
jgi:hypothetical protein